MEYDSALTTELLTAVIQSGSVYNQTRIADFGYIPECKSKNPRGPNEIALLLARMGVPNTFKHKQTSKDQTSLCICTHLAQTKSV